MHYLAFVIIPGEGDPDELVTETLAPFDYNLDVPARQGDTAEAELEPFEDEGNPRGLWDWWQIGGRWTGQLSGYDPHNDPALTEPCNQCQGTGRRDDQLAREWRASGRWAQDYGCNGCDSTGRARMWPTSWPRHDGDIVPMTADQAAAIDESKMPHALFTHGAESLALREWWDGEAAQQAHDAASMKKTLTATLAARERAGLSSRVVVVDYHS